MQRITELLRDAVNEQGGSARSFTGDGVVALFGVPQALEDAPLRACRAALAVHERLAAQAAEIEATCGLRPRLRIGINAGTAVVGRVDGEEGAGTTALGDTINLAARLQALAQPASVVLSEAVQRQVEGMVESRFAGEHQIKGKSEPQRVYLLEALRKGAVRFDVPASRGLPPISDAIASLRRWSAFWSRQVSEFVSSILRESPAWVSRGFSTSSGNELARLVRSSSREAVHLMGSKSLSAVPRRGAGLLPRCHRRSRSSSGAKA